MQIAPENWIDSSLEQQSLEAIFRKTILAENESLASSPDDRPKGSQS
jgi:hypothetical protein